MSCKAKNDSSSSAASSSEKGKEKPNLLAETGRHEAFELSALAHAMTEGSDDFDLDVEDIPREDWNNGSSGSSEAGQTTSISFGRELDEFPYSHFELTNETYDVVQAVHYYNTKVYPDLLTVMELAPNPYIIFFPLGALHFLPVSIQHSLACFALCHRIHQLPRETERLAITEKWSRVYYHRGVAIRELSEKISQDESRCNDATISSVVMFLCMELQQSTTPNWQSHADGLMKLLSFRGGLIDLFHKSPHMRPLLITFLLIAIFGNATSPPLSSIILMPSSSQLPLFITEVYDLIFPHVLCPPSLFLDIININMLRSQALNLCFTNDCAQTEAEELLSHIDAFSPEDWAQPNTSFHSEWLHIGTVYQSAVAVFCISSLQSVSILPNTVRLNAIRASHGDRLFLSLKAALISWQVRKFMLWPLVVAGVEAMNHGVAERSWVEDQLEKISRDIGSNSPLKARAVLREYWRKGRKGWDRCFDVPYAFIV